MTQVKIETATSLKKARHYSKLEKREIRYFYIFLAPAIISFLVLSAYPTLMTLFMSLFKWNMMMKHTFTGLANYVRMFTSDPNFWNSLWFTAKYAALSVGFGMLFSFLLGVMMTSHRKPVNVLRTLFYLPCMISAGSQTVLMWWYVLGNNGIFNQVLGYTGIQPVNWFSSQFILPSIIFMGLWGAGGGMIFFVSGIKGISDDFYEAAVIDGANAWKRMMRITLPMLSPVIVYNLIMGVIGALQQFMLAYVLNTFGASGMNFFALNIYNQAFKNNAFGYASALAVVLFLIVLGLTLLIFNTSGKWVFYGDES